jgi:hypothetical protein
MMPHAFMAEETLDFGEDTETPTAGYQNPVVFRGHINTLRFGPKYDK